MSASNRVFPFSVLTWLVATAVMAIFLSLVLWLRTATTESDQVRLFTMVVSYFPGVLIWVNAFLILIQRRKKHPQVSKYGLLGLSGFVLYWMGDHFLFVAWSRTLSSDTRQLVGVIQYCIGVAVKAGCWWLLFVAILGWREIDPDVAQPPD